MRNSPISPVIRFGVFELDPESGELRKAGVLLHLQPQPAKVLALLASRPGEVVTREEIREHVWGGETFIEFDQGLNTAVKQIRAALGDQPDSARFIQTLPRRGYRFVAPVEADSPPAADAPGEPRSRPADTPRSRGLWIGLAAGLAIGLLAVGLYALRVQPGEPAVRRFTLPSGQRLWIAAAATHVAISPDGRKIAYHGDGSLWIHDLTLDRRRRAEVPAQIFHPFWSPDSQRVGFFRQYHLMTVPADGGPPTVVCRLLDIGSSGGSWSPDGEVIVFAMGRRSKLYQVSANGGEPQLLLDPAVRPGAPDEPAGGVFHPRFAPAGRDSRIVLFAAGTQRDDLKLYIQDLRTGRLAGLGAGTLPQYSSAGHIVYQESGLRYSLWAAPFSLKRFATTGAPFLVAAHGRDPSLALDGTLVYVEAEFPSWRLNWRDRAGRSISAPGEPLGHMLPPVLSPDQRFAAIAGGRLHTRNDLWVQDLTKGTRTRLTHAEKELVDVRGPAWSPDGAMIAFRLAGTGIVLSRADGPGENQVLLRTPLFIKDLDWSRDGRRILYDVAHPDTGLDLFYLEKNESDGEWTAHPPVCRRTAGTPRMSRT